MRSTKGLVIVLAGAVAAALGVGFFIGDGGLPVKFEICEANGTGCFLDARQALAIEPSR
jgi:hypothetical protein